MRTNDLFVTEPQSRTSRFVEEHGQWFFRTREGIRFGGYGTRFDAELAACLLFTRVSQAESDAETRSVIAEFAHAQPMLYARSATQLGDIDGRGLPRGRSRTSPRSLRRWLDLGVASTG